MHDLLQELPCIYFSSSSEGVITDVNVTLTRFLGYERDELVGQKLELIFTLSTRIFQQTHLNPLLKLNGTAEEIYITLQTKVGEELPMLVNARRIEGDGGLYHCIYAGISVSKRKKFEDEIIAAKNQAEAAFKRKL
jgi:sigma-B regulation protein RsbU (phosphoserine phosphatase)